MPKYTVPPETNEDYQSVLTELIEFERRVLVGLVNGDSIKSLASTLCVTTELVAQARNALLAKLSAKSTADLVRIGLVSRVRWP